MRGSMSREQEIKIGQVWREKEPYHREGRVLHFFGDATRLEIIRRATHVGQKLDIFVDVLSEKWELVEPAPARRIALALAADTTDTECGKCPFSVPGSGYCWIWQEQCKWGEPIPGTKGGMTYQRLSECIAAEVK